MSARDVAPGSSSSPNRCGEIAQNNPIMDKNQLKRLLLNDKFECTVPYVHLYDTCYLDMVAESDPRVTIRLVFLARQLPRSLMFSKLVAPLRSTHLVDTFMIPHENKSVDPSSDVVVGFSGTLDRVCRALRDFLQDIASIRRGLYVWRLCVLVPREILSDLMRGHDPTLTYDLEHEWFESSVPELHIVLGRCYGPVQRNVQEDDHVFTVQSASLTSIMAAIRFIGEKIIHNESFGLGSDCFYTGGSPSVIPQALFANADLFRTAAVKFEHGVPLGYLLRPEMSQSWFRMMSRRLHLQVPLTAEQAVYLMSPSNGVDTRMQLLWAHHSIYLEISRNRESPDRVCDIGGNNHRDIAKAVAGLVDMLQQAPQPGTPLRLVRPGWQVRVIVPRRVADALDRDETQVAMVVEGVDVEVQEDVMGKRIPFRAPRERLEQREVEFTAVVKGRASIQGIEDGIHMILELMYTYE
ncbi:hypothetical protein BGZ74_001896 [Mortierella antarctica]|nr:hypothetical protein BGZ74_001896 [Mortierella antarctica]